MAVCVSKIGSKMSVVALTQESRRYLSGDWRKATCAGLSKKNPRQKSMGWVRVDIGQA